MNGLILAGLMTTLTACSNIFLQPDRVDYGAEVRKQAIVREGFIPAADGLQLHYWFLPAQIKGKETEAKGLVVHLHGNAQNLTSHVQNTGWLTAAGYNLFIFDYHGYGKSEGEKSLSLAFRDVQTALDYAVAKLNPKGLPLVVYGQSLGGNLGLKAISSEPKRWPVAAAVIEGSFLDYQQIAREKLALSWVTWPFQWLAYVAVSGKYSLKKVELESLSPVPVFLFYSQKDPIVPVHNGQDIYKMLKQPKELFEYPEFGHCNAMWVQNGKFRKTLLDGLAKASVQK